MTENNLSFFHTAPVPLAEETAAVDLQTPLRSAICYAEVDL